MNQHARHRTGAQRWAVARHRFQNSSANPRQNYEKYLARAHEAKVAGDAVEMENCHQHAEHYYRLMRGSQ